MSQSLMGHTSFIFNLVIAEGIYNQFFLVQQSIVNHRYGALKIISGVYKHSTLFLAVLDDSYSAFCF